jgi:hypothetical protein
MNALCSVAVYYPFIYIYKLVYEKKKKGLDIIFYLTYSAHRFHNGLQLLNIII